ncbi:unnamed protein product [Oreochromis niloticus]|nr:unnamed protein product [Mustela putorius furo]
MGSCSYTLTKPCNVSSGLPHFTVHTQNEHRGSNKKVSYVRAVVIDVNGITVILGKGHTVQVNGTAVVPPVTSIRGVKIYMSGKFVVLETSFNLRVRFDGNHHADVTLPTSYNGLLCGMCGNFNGNPDDDNLKPDNTPAANTNELGDSWQVADSDPDCTDGTEEEDCDVKVEEEATKPTSCGMITDLNGIFKPCHSVVSPEPYFESCVFDMCATGGETVALCQAIETYADMCAAAGVPIEWRTNTFCPLKCLPGSHYTPCGPACPQPSCQNPAGHSGSCSLPCVEGCICDTGLILSGDKCVPLSQCGCTDDDGKYRPVGDTWFTKADCSEQCKCAGNNNISCESWQCSPAQECKVVEGVLGCHSTGKGVCHVAGDPHYYTFDVLSCTANSTYSPCMSSCPASCANLAAPSECEVTSCVEGCQCATGFVMSEGTCVPYAQCGCTFLNRYYPLKEKFVTEDCSQSCECSSTGAVCEPKTCQDGYVCTIYNFKRDCYKASPCLSYPCLNEGTCQDSGNNTYTCLCAEGFEGTNCEREAIPPTGGGLETKWIILIAVLVPVAVIIITVTTVVLVCKKKTMKKKNNEKNISMESTSVPYTNIDNQKKVKVTAF